MRKQIFGENMAWTERFVCDVCNKIKGDSETWWLAMQDCQPSLGDSASHPLLKLLPWNHVLAHSADARHLCGAVCVHKYLDRWMGDLLAADGVPECGADAVKR